WFVCWRFGWGCGCWSWVGESGAGFLVCCWFFCMWFVFCFLCWVGCGFVGWVWFGVGVCCAGDGGCGWGWRGCWGCGVCFCVLSYMAVWGGLVECGGSGVRRGLVVFLRNVVEGVSS
ncbi:hypothetical protein RA268_28170, partial [Pseudomonas syringae pv. tagetis]